MENFGELTESVAQGRNLEAKKATQNALEMGLSPIDILHKGLQPGLDIIGARFKSGEAYIPEMLLAARAMQEGMKLLRPLLAQTGAKPIGKVVLGTVKDDLHDIGKNMVGMMLEGAGFQVIDLGINVSADRFIESLKREDAPLLALSALLSTTMPMLKETIEGLKQSGMRDKVKVIVGGAPVTEAYAASIGADGYAPDAVQAAEKAKELLGI